MSYESPIREVNTQWANVAGNNSQQARGKKKKKKKRKRASGPEEIRKEGKSPTSWLGKNLYQANMQAHEAIRRNIASSEAHGLHFMEDTHEQKRHIEKRDTTETTREQKKKKC